MKNDTKKKILDYLKKHRQAKPAALAKHVGISRAAMHKNLLNMTIFDGTVEKKGRTPHVFYSLDKSPQKKRNPHYLWDYDYDELQKTEQGRIKILERMINYGPGEGKKIPLKLVKKYWDKLEIHYLARRLLELLIWGKYQSSLKNKKFSWI